MNVRLRLAGLGVLAFALAACGNPGGNGSKVASISDPAKPSNQQNASDNRSDEDKIRDFTKCMREHGVDLPEPSSAPKAGGGGEGGGGGGIVIQGAGPDKEKIDKANEACRPLLPNGGKPPKLDAKQLDEMRKMAQCMREHGVNMPDPDPNNPGMGIGPDSGVDPDAMDKAAKACAPEGAEIHTQKDGSGTDAKPNTGSGPK
jgi:hypothetical protein